jgi:hypothetical protein
MSDVESRLRGALAARAAGVTPERLRPPVPPTMLRPTRRPVFALARRVAWVAWVATALAVVTLTFLTLRPTGTEEPRQRPPAVTPAPPDADHSPSPSPEPVSPSPVRSTSTSPLPSYSTSSLPFTSPPGSRLPEGSSPRSSP